MIIIIILEVTNNSKKTAGHACRNGTLVTSAASGRMGGWSAAVAHSVSEKLPKIFEGRRPRDPPDGVAEFTAHYRRPERRTRRAVT